MEYEIQSLKTAISVLLEEHATLSNRVSEIEDNLTLIEAQAQIELDKKIEERNLRNG